MTHMEAPGSRPRRSRTRKPRDHARGGCAHGSPGIAPGGFYDAHGSPGITPAAVTHMEAPSASEGITRRKPRTRHFTARLLPDRASRGGSRVRDTLPPACCLIGHHGMPTMQAAILSHPRDTAMAAEIPLKPATAFFSRGRLPGLGCGSVRHLAPHKRESAFGTAFASRGVRWKSDAARTRRLPISAQRRCSIPTHTRGVT